MKRIFTSLLLAATCSFGASAQVSTAQTLLPKAAEPEYAIPQGNANLRQNQDGSRATQRLVYSFGLTGATVNGVETPFTSTINKRRGGSQPEVFVDRTSETVELSAGDKVSINLDHGIEWMHSYLYIDYNHDGTFDQDKELVAYSFYSEGDQSWGTNSLGKSVENKVNPSNIPGFTVDPNAASVTTRMRLKIDWNSKDPIGNPKQSIGANAGTIVDFTVKIYGKQVAAKVPVTLNESVNGTYKVLNVAGEEIKKGQEVEIGSQLKVVPTPAEGYRLKDILVNGSPVKAEELFTIEGETTIQVNFEKDVQMWTVTYSATKGGSVIVLDYDGNPINSGDKVKDGTLIGGCKFTNEQGYTLASVLVNGVEMIGQCMYTPFGYMLELSNPIKSDLNIEVIFKSESAAAQYAVTWDEPSNGTMQVIDAKGHELYSGQEVDEGTILTVKATPAEGFRLKEILVNGNAVNPGAEFIVTEATTISVSFEADVPMHKISISATEGGSFKVTTETGEEIKNGQEVAEGTTLKVEATPLDGYAVKTILVNGASVKNNSSFAVLRATTIEASFIIADMWSINFESTEGGTITVLDAQGLPMKSGDKVKDGSVISGCKFNANEGFELTSVKINDNEVIDQCMNTPVGYVLELNSTPVKEDLNISAVFTAKETGITEAALAEAAYNAGTQSLNIPAGAYAVVYNAAGQQVMNVQGGQTVSTSSLAHGAYVVRVVAEGGVKVIKFVQK